MTFYNFVKQKNKPGKKVYMYVDDTVFELFVEGFDWSGQRL